jgi:two-component system, sensor histidine kinase and response regulator
VGADRHSVSSLRTYRVLCVDDHASGLKIRKMFLESFGYSVQTARSGPEALEQVRNTDFDVVVLDYRMPEMNGLELARSLRQQCPSLPLIVLSGYASGLPRELHEIASGFVAKGSHPEALLEELARVMGARPRPKREREEVSTAELLDRSRHYVEESKRQVQKAHEVTSRARNVKPGRRSA